MLAYFLSDIKNLAHRARWSRVQETKEELAGTITSHEWNCMTVNSLAKNKIAKNKKAKTKELKTK